MKTFLAYHNDFYRRRESNYGQHFVATWRPHSTAYDSMVDQTRVWMRRSPFAGNSPQHIRYDRCAELVCRVIADNFNRGRLILCDDGSVTFMSQPDADGLVTFTNPTGLL